MTPPPLNVPGPQLIVNKNGRNQPPTASQKTLENTNHTQTAIPPQKSNTKQHEIKTKQV